MFEGIITPIVTPFHRNLEQSINYEEAKKLINHLIEKGVHGIFILGSNGEFHVMEEEEKLEFAKEVVAVVNHRVPVFAGTGVCSTKESIRLSRKMEQIGVDALSVITPYFLKPTEEELFEHFRAIAESVHIPIILYNIPKATGCNLSSGLVGRLAQTDNIWGIKDSSGDIENLKGYIEACRDTHMTVLVGSDSLISKGYSLGASGAIAGTSNLITDTLVNLFHALKQGRQEEARTLQADIDVLRGALKLGTVPSVLKRSIELAGIAEVGPARRPVAETTLDTDHKIKEMLRYYHMI